MAKKTQVPENTKESGDKGFKYVQLKLPNTLAEELERSGKVANRSLPAQVLHILQEAQQPVPDALSYGWAAPAKAKALADMLGALAGDILDYSAPDPDKDLWTALAMLRIAMVDLLNGAGAAKGLEGDKEGDQEATARLIARQYLKDLDRVAADPSAYGQRPYHAKLAAFKKEWLENSISADKPKE